MNYSKIIAQARTCAEKEGDRFVLKYLQRYEKCPERYKEELKGLCREYDIDPEFDEAEQWVADCQSVRDQIEHCKGKIKLYRDLSKVSVDAMWGRYDDAPINHGEAEEKIEALHEQLKSLEAELRKLERR